MSLEDLAMKHPAAIGPIAQGMKELSGRREAAHRQMTEGIVKALEIATKGNLDPRDVEMQLTQAMRARAGRDLMVALTYAFAEVRQSRPHLFSTAGRTPYNPTPGGPA